jgi:hypothetical protein
MSYEKNYLKYKYKYLDLLSKNQVGGVYSIPEGQKSLNYYDHDTGRTFDVGDRLEIKTEGTDFFEPDGPGLYGKKYGTVVGLTLAEMDSYKNGENQDKIKVQIFDPLNQTIFESYNFSKVKKIDDANFFFETFKQPIEPEREESNEEENFSSSPSPRSAASVPRSQSRLQFAESSSPSLILSSEDTSSLEAPPTVSRVEAPPLLRALSARSSSVTPQEISPLASAAVRQSLQRQVSDAPQLSLRVASAVRQAPPQLLQELSSTSSVSLQEISAMASKVPQLVRASSEGAAVRQATQRPTSEAPHLSSRLASAVRQATQRPASEAPHLSSRLASAVRQATQRPASERPASERPTSERPASERPASAVRQATQLPVSERPASAVRPATQLPVSERPVSAVRQSTQLPVSERPVSAVRPVSERSALERLALERSALARQVSERSALERSALERSALERLALERPVSVQLVPSESPRITSKIPNISLKPEEISNINDILKDITKISDTNIKIKIESGLDKEKVNKIITKIKDSLNNLSSKIDNPNLSGGAKPLFKKSKEIIFIIKNKSVIIIKALEIFKDIINEKVITSTMFEDLKNFDKLLFILNRNTPPLQKTESPSLQSEPEQVDKSNESNITRVGIKYDHLNDISKVVISQNFGMLTGRLSRM